MTKRRVVVTGLGALTPLGNNVATTWKRILNGESGISSIEHFDTSAYTTHFGGSIRDFDVSKYLNAKEAKYLDTFVQYGIASAIQAIEDAAIDFEQCNRERCGASIGAGIGGIGAIEKNNELIHSRGPRRISPFFVPGSIINMISGHVAIRHGLKGPNVAMATACTTGTHSIGFAARMIQYGDADVMVTGGAEMATTPVGLGGFCAARALSTNNENPQGASRPWDRDRDGFVLSDGSAALVLEEYEHAKARGAKIYCELTGFGMSDDAYHMTSPPEDGSGAALSMQNALSDAGIKLEQINYVNAHGTSTRAGDRAECQALKTVFGDHAYQFAVSSTKSMIGHLLGAAGAVEAVFSVLAIRDQVAPPTINLDNPEEGFDLNFVPHSAQPMEIHSVLSNSFGFGGTNGSLIFSRVDD